MAEFLRAYVRWVALVDGVEVVAEGMLPKAVVTVDLYGQSADYDRLEASCLEFGVPLIEDAAEALERFGARCHPPPHCCARDMRPRVFSKTGSAVCWRVGGGAGGCVSAAKAMSGASIITTSSR